MGEVRNKKKQKNGEIAAKEVPNAVNVYIKNNYI